MEIDDNNDLDTHVCLLCNVHMVGLEKYIDHKKFLCPYRRQKQPAQMINSAETAMKLEDGLPAELYDDANHVDQSQGAISSMTVSFKTFNMNSGI